MKKLVLSLLFFLFSSFCFAVDNVEQKKVSSRYKTVTYDIFGGLMYGAGFNKFYDVQLTGISNEIRTNSLYIFAGVDLYAGGYYDKIAKRYKEYLISPMFGVQFDYNVWNKSSDSGNLFNLKNHLNLLFRLGVLFKLKFDTNAKLYFTFGMAHNGLQVYGNTEIVNNIGTIVKKVKTINGVIGFGLDFVIKQHFLVGFEYRANWLDKDYTNIKLDQDNTFPLNVSLDSIILKFGASF